MKLNLDAAGIGSAFDFASGIMDRFFPKKMNEEEKIAVVASIAQAVDERDANRDASRDEKRAHIVATELQQGDSYTKRARPSVVYAGLLFTLLNNVIFPVLIYICSLAGLIYGFKNPEAFKAFLEFAENNGGLPKPPQLTLPPQFWTAWGGICATWVIGRTVERRGLINKTISMITGNKK